MDMHVLAVTSDPAERAQLEQIRGPAATDDAVITLQFAATLAELAALADGAAPAPDLILLNPLLADAPPGALWQALGTAGDRTPLVLLAPATGLSPAEQAVRLGAVTYLVTAATPRELLRRLLQSVVVATRLGRPPLDQQGQDALVLESIADAVISTDEHAHVSYCNLAARRLLGLEVAQMLGRPIADLMRLQDPKSLADIEHPVWQALASGAVVRIPAGCILSRPDGSELMIEDSTAPIHDGRGRVCGVVMVFHDITNARELQAQVDHLAWHDFLTGLPNRFAAHRHLNRILKEAQAAGQSLAVMYLDLDKFKLVNDTLGHAAGDALLVSVAARLRSCFRVVDLVSRQGGDEFVVLMAPGSSRLDATQAAQRISAAVALPHQLDGEPVHVGCSIGIALYPGDGDSGDVLLRHADTALHAAKAAGRNVWRFFQQELLSSAIERRQLENGLRQALGSSEFELFYQPKVRLRDGALCGCEALLRWQHPAWGWVDPARFIRSAEESGLIIPLGRWVLGQAVRQARRWEQQGLLPGAVAVNVSALELRQGDFADHIGSHLAQAGLDPARLQLELTESALMRDMHGAHALLHRLKGIGVSLAIDDFGTGYSSLSYLADLPIDLLKVDRSFVHGIDHAAPRRQTLLRAVLALADNLAIAVVAEGVETAPEADFLAAAGCGQGQGYFYSRAVDARTFERRFLAAAPGAP
ncbi:diguanylate cyclase (GGDEF)-like protein/PAS domain S-box-containing protein [Duganella sp. 1224]|uniref:putative bifunctional diguanylate cyclase/phosphodiesterase n=1 Tax=Duganella sp. 1224 TaxID=2587052 RepID=UPI0015CAB277|nr:EAL domain-containing protein [Duganella sp. 1224]NYE63170.1 diguanylate cyclase (GGDEF)-like protein/PAS domain S-box-containing protein [Duganella sp. 1224]